MMGFGAFQDTGKWGGQLGRKGVYFFSLRPGTRDCGLGGLRVILPRPSTPVCWALGGQGHPERWCCGGKPQLVVLATTLNYFTLSESRGVLAIHREHVLEVLENRLS